MAASVADGCQFATHQAAAGRIISCIQPSHAVPQLRLPASKLVCVAHSACCACACVLRAGSQAAIAAVERHHADELREEVQELRDLCNFYQQENEELTMVTGLYQRQIEEIKQKLETVPPPGRRAAGLHLVLVCHATAMHDSGA